MQQFHAFCFTFCQEPHNLNIDKRHLFKVQSNPSYAALNLLVQCLSICSYQSPAEMDNGVIAIRSFVNS